LGDNGDRSRWGLSFDRAWRVAGRRVRNGLGVVMGNKDSCPPTSWPWDLWALIFFLKVIPSEGCWESIKCWQLSNQKRGRG
jgi:hypothetical protein